MLIQSTLALLCTFGVFLSSASSVQHPPQRWASLDGQPPSDEPAEYQSAPEEYRYRLPTYIVPTHYVLYLESNVHNGNRSYSGRVDIHLDIRQQTRTIYVHNRGLTIRSNTLTELGGDEGNSTLPETLLFTEDREREFITFALRRTLAVGPYILSIEFEGQLRTDNDGFYISSFEDEDGTMKYLAATQLQAISARSAFPCLDEPALKATIELQIKHHPSYWVVANTPMTVSAGDDDGYVVDYFETTPRMSVYLLAFMVSNFVYVENDFQRVLVRPTAINETQYALEAGTRVLAALDDYLGLPYQGYMAKMDQAAIPDFSAGAMENWGLCKYREEYLLYRDGVSTYQTQTSITTIIAHEFAHQWFGNVVTNEWWSYLWLNEGFATLYEYMAADLAYPERQYRELFNVQVVQSVFVSDASPNTRPMTLSRGATFSTISSLFDNVAYSKAGSVLQMFRQLVTDETWRQIIRAYLERNEFDSVNEGDLVAAMEEATQNTTLLPDTLDMETFVQSWATQAGYPVLDVRRTPSGSLLVSQDRYYSNQIVNDDQTVWMIPYTILEEGTPATEANPLEWQWLTARAALIPAPTPADRWILANVNQTGFYRVNYDPANWQLLIGALLEDSEAIPLHSRAQLVDDSFNLARSNRLDMLIALEILAYVRHERHYPPWAAANRVFTYFDDRLRGSDDYPWYQLFVDTMVGDVFATLNVTGVPADELLLDKYLKRTISSWACRMGIEGCLEETRAALEREVAGEEAVHPDVAAVVYCYGLRATNASAFQYLYDKLKASDNRAERSLLISSLGCSNDASELSAYLQTSIGGGLQVNYSPDERYSVLTSALANRDGVDALISFLTYNYPYVVSTLGQGRLNSLVQSIATRTNTLEEEQMLSNLLQRLEGALPAASVANARSTVSRNRAWPSTREGVLVSYFLQRYHPEPTVDRH